MRAANVYFLFCFYLCFQTFIVAKDGEDDTSSFGQILSVNQEASKLVDSSKANLKRTFFEGDIVLTAKSDIYPNRANSEIQFGSASDINLLWPRKTIPYILDDSIKFERGRTTLNAIEGAFAEFANKTCIKFKERTDERDYIKLFKGGGCWSLVGRKGGRQDLSLGTGCEQKGVVTHELMHALGFWHEQSRPDRDTYVEIVTDNILDGYEDQFKKYDRGEIDSRGSKYDYRSIMHYGATAFTKNGKDTLKIRDSTVKVRLGQREGLSALDIQQIGNLYKCNTKPVNGNWGKWSVFSDCSKSCGYGKQVRFRECNNPPAMNGGEQCPGRGREEKSCFIKACSVNCDFDRGTCMWTEASDDDFDWRRRKGTTPSDGTGPSNDHTQGSSQGYYLYAEASSPQKQWDVARFVSPPIKGSASKRCLSFWYSMIGATIGALEVVVEKGSSKNALWLLKGPQGSSWKEGHIPIPSSGESFKVSFNAVRGLDYRGDIAIDDIQLIDGSCDLKPSIADPSESVKPVTVPPPITKTIPNRDQGLNCSFESSNCLWKDTYDKDYIDWIRNRGRTVSQRTGPDVDHTTGTIKGYYLYIEGSSPQVTGDNARLVSPKITVDASKNPTCLRFYYFMYGGDIGELKVSIAMSSGSEGMLWSLKGQQGSSWKEASVPLPTQQTYQIVIEGVIGRSFLSDIAIDDISVTSGPCALYPPKASVKPIVPGKPKPTKAPVVIQSTPAPSGSSELIIDVLAVACNDPAVIARDTVSGKVGLSIGGGRLGFHRGAVAKKRRPGGGHGSHGDHGRGRGRGRGYDQRQGTVGEDNSKDDSDDPWSIFDISSRIKRDISFSTGCSNAKSSIRINGVDYITGKEGHNVVVVNARTGKVFRMAFFDTKTNVFASVNLEQYINDLPPLSVFIIATQGKADSQLLLSSKTYFPPKGGSLALVGYKGSQKIEWIKRDENPGGRGPSRLKLKLKMNFESKTMRKLILLKQETFSGTTFIPIPTKYNDVLNMGVTDFTITAWIKTKADGVILSRTSPAKTFTTGMKIIYIVNGKIKVMLTSKFVESGQTSVADGRWHHVALLVQGGNSPNSVALYVDGRQEWQKYFTPVRDDPTYVLKVAHAIQSLPTYMGEIKSLVYYDKVISKSVLNDILKVRPS